MMEGKYDDIIGLEYKGPKRHPRMSIHERAAQFAPFAALTGYDDVIAETGRLTGSKIELDEEQRASLNAVLQTVRGRLLERPEVLLTYFRPDSRKAGGTYLRIKGHVRNIDEASRLVVLADGPSIPIDDLFSIFLI
ncbi:MAG: hypothetical protein VZQ27_05830 [Candidatus Cryptobacteroides sp.]|nr:hypothetical protein [Bacteroidales bacterium]MEE3463800.1 hypothetical protein [Candidatus Cryptobacteroides sp.]